MAKAISAIYLVDWTESEAGWGCRPDGISLHTNKGEADKYIKEYWDREKKINPSGVVPHEYSSPSTPRLVEIDPKVLKKVMGKKESVRLWQHEIRELNSKGIKIDS